MNRKIWDKIIRALITLIVVGIALYFGRMFWVRYTQTPWTRDGRVRANIIPMAPDVSGLITQMDLKDNQEVRKGDLLFTIDRDRYQLAVEQAEAHVRASQIELDQHRREAERRRMLKGSPAISAEAIEVIENTVLSSEATHRQSEIALETARLNLARTEVRSPVNGFVTNLQLDLGDYASTGKPVLALVNRDSFYISGYFEETKIRYISPNAPVKLYLMSGGEPVLGHVESIALAIADRDNITSSGDLVANVNPTFSWVRLAQRIPVRISIDHIPPGTRLAAGMTVTVQVEEQKK